MSTQENLFWTEKISLGTIRDPLQLAVFRFPDQYFLTGITTQTQRIRYYTFLTWAWNQIKEKKSDRKKILDMEKILALVSAQHHENGDEPSGIRNIGDPKNGAKKFLLGNSQIDVEKFGTTESGTSFGRNNRYGYGEYYHRGPLANLDVVWKDEKNELIISPAGKEISTIFSEYIGKNKDKIWAKTLTKPDLQKMVSLCCCSIPTEEQSFWKNVFFGLTTLGKDGLKIDHEKQLEILDPDELSFEKFKISEDKVMEISEGKVTEDDIILDDLNFEVQEDIASKTMRQGTLFLLLEIINNSKPEKKSLSQTIRDCIYYSEFQAKGKISTINFNKLEPYRKYWEVYVHNLYYVTIFEKTLSIILDISKQKATGIEIDELVSKIDTRKFLDSVRKFGGFQISDSDNVQTVYEKLKSVIGGKKTTLSSPINEHDLLEKIRNTDDRTETLGLIFILFLLCKYRYSSFHKEELRILSYKEDRFHNIHPRTRYEKFSNIPVTEFPERLLKFVIKRHRRVSAKKLINNNTKAWLFTIEDDFLYFNEDYKFQQYRDAKWKYVLEIMNDLGLIQNNSDKEIWEITKEGEEWLKKIQ